LRFRNLARAHFRGQLIAPALGGFHAAHRGQVEPFVSRDHIHSHALAGGISQTEIVERVCTTFFRVPLILRE